eukprot:scaffold19191_cov134-Isochrysis_galbana.AAC.3
MRIGHPTHYTRLRDWSPSIGYVTGPLPRSHPTKKLGQLPVSSEYHQASCQQPVRLHNRPRLICAKMRSHPCPPRLNCAAASQCTTALG